MSASGNDAIFIGGPRDGTPFATAQARPRGSAGSGADGGDGPIGLVQLEIDGLIHRYVRTTVYREATGGRLLVYSYDGEVDPSGAQSGAESR